MVIDKPQEEIDPNLFSNLTKQIPVWHYKFISRKSYLAFSCEEKEKLNKNYYQDTKSCGSWEFFIIILLLLR